MVITCPYCKSSKDVGDVKIPKDGVEATCKSCQRKFPVYSNQEPVSTIKADRCPSCGVFIGIHGEGDICPQCGLVYAKYLDRQARRAIDNESVQNAELAKTAEKPHPGKLLVNRYLLGISLLVVLSVWVRFGYDWQLNKGYLLKPSTWQGEMSFRGKKHPFLLVIESTDRGRLEGYMDWIETIPRYRLAIRGTYNGNHLLFEDYKFVEGSGQFGLHDKKDVYIKGNEMNGSDKNGKAVLHAVQVATYPDSIIDLNK